MELYEIGLSIGLKKDEILDMTPLEFELNLNNYYNNEKSIYDKLIYLSWHIEVFSRIKKLPDLNTLISKNKRNNKKKTKKNKLDYINIAKKKNLNGFWNK